MLDDKSIFNDKAVNDEYERAIMLNILASICNKIDSDSKFDDYVRKSYRQSYDDDRTTRRIVHEVMNYDMNVCDSHTMTMWINAHLNKQSSRAMISIEEKQKMYDDQHGLCVICNCPLGSDWSIIHADHIIPWKYVGDELENNLQLLCQSCNDKKGAKTDYMFKKVIKLE